MPIQTNLILRANLSRPLTWLEGDTNWSLLLSNDQFLNGRIDELNTSVQNVATAASNADAKAVTADGKAVAAQQSADQANTGLLQKVDKVEGYGLSQNNYTTAEKEKLAGLESSRFKGQFTSLENLAAEIPVGEIGDYANVDPGAGSTVQRALWDSDDNEWVLSGSGGGQMTPAQIREGYLSNPDTNNFSDADKAKLDLTEVYTADEKVKVAGVQEGAQQNYPEMDQATAEAGVGTSLLSVTALRLRQAILGWWNNSSFKTKLDTLPVAPVADGKSYVLKDRSWIEIDAKFAYVYPNGGNATSPGTVAVNQRYATVDNPFPGKNVICIAQIRVNNIWTETGWYGTYADRSYGYGVKASEYNGKIVVQTGKDALMTDANVSGNPTGANGNITAATPCRVLVFTA